MLDRTSQLLAELPAVEIPPAVLAKLQIYVEECAGEIGGFGLMRALNGILLVDDVFIGPQRSTPTNTEMDAEDLAAFLDECIGRGIDPGRLHLYWHSHADMDVFWSHTDLQTIETAFPQAPWVLALVLNRRGELKSCLQIYQPIRLRLHDLPVRLHLPDSELRPRLRAEIRRKVRPGHTPWAVSGDGRPIQLARFSARVKEGG
jgi:proteasome lid subunit RPN8/RPN11